MIKAIILAAGEGTRIKRYAQGKPKCLLDIGGKSILRRQIDNYRRAGLQELVVVRGYAAESIAFEGLRYYENTDFKDTNMVYSLFCAKSELVGSVIISYGDILFEDRVLQTMLKAEANDIAVAVDTAWEEYYRMRFKRPYEEAESLVYDHEHRISRIGEARPEPEDVQGQYIGLIKLTDRGCQIFREKYESIVPEYWGSTWMRGRLMQKAFMTDFLQALVDDGVNVHVVPIQRGWLEFDYESDYENVLSMLKKDELSRFITLD